MERKIDVGAALSNAAGKLEKALEMIRDTSKFVSEQGVSEVLVEETKLKDGIYIVYNDGSYSPFNEHASKDGVHGIGVVYDGHSFQVALEDLGEQPLIEEGNNSSPDESSFYKTECEGLHDWDFVSATNHLRECGMNMPLPIDWYIPTLAVLEAMCFLKEKINEAIKFAGGNPMPDDYHWSSTESGRNNARIVYFSNGYAFNNYKYNTYVIRPVTAF